MKIERRINDTRREDKKSIKTIYIHTIIVTIEKNKNLIKNDYKSIIVDFNSNSEFFTEKKVARNNLMHHKDRNFMSCLVE